MKTNKQTIIRAMARGTLFWLLYLVFLLILNDFEALNPNPMGDKRYMLSIFVYLQKSKMAANGNREPIVSLNYEETVAFFSSKCLSL